MQLQLEVEVVLTDSISNSDSSFSPINVSTYSVPSPYMLRINITYCTLPYSLMIYALSFAVLCCIYQPKQDYTFMLRNTPKQTP